MPEVPRDPIFVLNIKSSPTLPVKYCRQPVGGSLCEEHSTIVTWMNIYILKDHSGDQDYQNIPLSCKISSKVKSMKNKFS